MGTSGRDEIDLFGSILGDLPSWREGALQRGGLVVVFESPMVRP